MERKTFRYIGRTLRILIFILNALGWVTGILCLLGAILVGFYSKTLKINWFFDLYDFTLTTPCTVVFYYGVVLGIVTISGCFAGSGGRWWWTGTYCLLLIALALFDYFYGIRVFFNKSSLVDFLDDMFDTMNYYGVNSDKKFGIIPRGVDAYWDHIQRQSHCCGMYQWEDWKRTPFGNKNHLPDSCCNEKYGLQTCGEFLFHHPDNADHQTLDLIHTKGCLRAYPRRFIWAFHEASIAGIILGIIFLLCFLLSLFLFLIVVTCCYRPGRPITEEHKSKKHKRHSLKHHHHKRHSTDDEAKQHSTDAEDKRHSGRRRHENNTRSDHDDDSD